VCAVRSIHLRNTTGLVLAPGKISVFEEGRIAANASFPPMLPGDDQLVPIGQDSTVSILRSCTNKRHVSAVTPFQLEEGKVTGVVVEHKHQRVTSYVIQNNATKTVDMFYLDHTASPGYDGFQIMTSEHCVKEAVGFARYMFRLQPQEELHFDVVEEAVERTLHSKLLQIKEFLKAQAPQLQEEGLLPGDLCAALEQLIVDQQLKDIIQVCMGSNTTDIAPKIWRAKVPLPTEWEALMQACEEFRRIKSKLDLVERDITSHRAHTSAIFESQSRLRENIKALENMPQSPLMERYMRDLDLEEDQLIQTRQQIGELSSEQATLKESLMTSKAQVQSIARDYKETGKMPVLATAGASGR